MNDLFFKLNQWIGKYKLISLLGTGLSGEVWSAVSMVSNEAVAIKIFRKNTVPESQIKYEYSMATKVRHPNLLRLFSLEKIEGFWVMEMPLCMGRSVDGIVGYMSEHHAWNLIYDIASALSALHLVGMGHFDVKPSNILWDGQRFVIADFGACRKLDISQKECLVASDDSSYRFDAPELMKGVCVSASDIWSLGATVFNLLMGCHVFNGLGGRAQLENSPVPYMRKNMPVLSEWIVRCLAYDYKLRPTASEIVAISGKQMNVQSLKRRERILRKEEDLIASVENKTYFWLEDMVEKNVYE